jgi:hypothetical protein
MDARSIFVLAGGASVRNNAPMFAVAAIYLRLAGRYLLGRPANAADVRVCRARRRFLVAFPLFEIPTVVCLALDRIFFPSHARRPIRQPVFIIGNPRSGTTLFHRLLSRDRERFHCFRTWEIFAPSILQQRVAAWLGRRDARRGGRLRRRIEAAEARRFAGFAHIHRVGLFLPEEDGKVLIHVLASAFLTWFFPPREFGSLVRFDLDVPADRQRSILAFYAACVRRHAYAQGGARQLLSKNPMFTGMITALQRAFPDCKFVCLVRNPLDTIPSTISLSRALMGRNDQPDATIDRAIYAQLCFFYRHALDGLAALPPDRCVFVKYDELLRDPRQTVEGVYRQLGFATTSAFAAELAREETSIRTTRSEHRYSLDACAVTRDEIVADLRPVFDRFSFDTRA